LVWPTFCGHAAWPVSYPVCRCAVDCPRPAWGHWDMRNMPAAADMTTTRDPHLSLVRPVSAQTPGGCEECLILGATWVQLRLCLTWGHVGLPAIMISISGSSSV